MYNISFNAHHSPWGAYMSFILGKFGEGGGITSNSVYSPKENIYAGFTRQSEGTRIFPFASLIRNDFEEAFGIEKGDEDEAARIEFFKESEISRTYKAASDSFEAQGLTLKFFSPFDAVPNLSDLTREEKRQYLLPAVLIELTMDNSDSDEEATFFFGMRGYRRIFGDSSTKIAGGAMGTSKGFASCYQKGIEEHIGVNLLRQITIGRVVRYRLGNEIIVSLKVAPRQKGSMTFAAGAYEDGIITSGITAAFAYRECFDDIEDVLLFALDNADYYKELANKCDEELECSELNTYRKFLHAHSVHSYLASTQLLRKQDGGYIWVANEGEYGMMNTLDLTIDHMFWELKQHPWTVSNTLDLFSGRYSYYEGVQDIWSNIFEGGISFCHDMGVANMFSMEGISAYEMRDFKGCFSYMTMEQLLNWVLCACVYGISQKDIKWLDENKGILRDCLNSIIARDRDGDGIMDADSVKCGKGGEITTYDSLDTSLGQARNNLYIAVKTWAALVCMKTAFDFAKMHEHGKTAEQLAVKAAKSIIDKFDSMECYIPAVFENENTSRIIPAIEALVYPWCIGLNDVLDRDGPYGDLINTLCKHINTVLVKGICIEPNSGGWKLSSTSKNTWMSKVFISQFVAGQLLNINAAIDSLDADKAHVKWQTEGCSEYCAVDQINVETGTALGSRLYPRLVTSVLWL